MVDFIGKIMCPYCNIEMILENPLLNFYLLNKYVCPKCGYRYNGGLQYPSIK